MRALFASGAFAAAVNTAPPCGTPPGVVPVIAEGLCYTVVAPVDASGVSVRSYAGPANATFISGLYTGAPYQSGVQGAISTVLNYFSGNNDEQRNILTARTVPFAITSFPYPTWTAHIQVSPTQFPDNFLIPNPNPGPVKKSLVSASLSLIASFQFNTSGFPYLQDFQEACGVIQNSTLPSGYAINTTDPWSPTYVFYNGQNDANFTNECWMAVFKL